MIIGPFPDWTNLEECVDYCSRMAKAHKKMAPFYVTKFPDRDNYNIAGELECLCAGGKVLYSSDLGYLKDNQQQQILLIVLIKAVKHYMKFQIETQFKPNGIEKEIVEKCLLTFANKLCQSKLDFRLFTSIANELLINY